MDARRSTRKLLAGLGLAAFSIGLVPGSAAALPSLPSSKQPFKLFARAISFINVNRVYMGINSAGTVGVDSAGCGNCQGGFWPRGSANNYVFAAGMQIAGIVGGVKSAANPWGGDTSGGWFYNGLGVNQTEAVTPAYQAFNANDVANWPADAYVPDGDFVADIYAEPLRGLVSASQGDVHFIAWEGNPLTGTAAQRKHPLGILLDYRLLAWNFPAGAQDIVFLVLTVYNITSSDCSDYAAHRAGIRQILCDQGVKFQTASNAKFGIQLPTRGYAIENTFLAVAGDNDVGNAGNNYDSAILPLALGFSYEATFSSAQASAPGWKFDPSIFGPPFFAGTGFVGYKYLKGPDGPGVIQLVQMYCFGNTGCNGHADPTTMEATYRALAGTPTGNDGTCNVTAPGKTPAEIHFCFILNTTLGGDVRLLQSSAPLTLAPGQGKSIVMAFVYAAPVQIPGFVASSATAWPPGNPTWSNSTDSMFKYNASGAPGVTKIDSLAGFLAYTGPHFNGDGTVHEPTQNEFTVVKGSLYGKALVAQAVFDVQFLQEFAPDAPTFFLIPGDKQVTILWKPSTTETIGDPYFGVVSSATKVVAGLTVPNPLYDPNYRKFDVEGYRIYRGRSDNPSALKLLAQFDYVGTTYRDFTGSVLNGNCAPEIGVGTDCPTTTPAGGFPTATLPTPAGLGPAVPVGTAYTRQRSYNIGPQLAVIGALPIGSPLRFVDQTSGTRIALPGGTTTLTQVVDTTVSGLESGSFPALVDNGVPFIFIDKAGATGCTQCGVNNGVRYYYAVTAFDVNAPTHGPTSLESAKVTKQVTPQSAPGNISVAATINSGTFGRSTTPLTDAVQPSVNATTGIFSKKFPPSTALAVVLGGVPSQIINGTGSASVRYDSTSLVSAVAGTSVTVNDWLTVGTTVVSLPFTVVAGASFATTTHGKVLATFPALTVDSALSSVFGGGAGFSVVGSYTYTRPTVVVRGRGCANSWWGAAPTGKAANQCYFYGPRWFIGDQETASNPGVVSPAVQANAGILAAAQVTSFANAGTVTGATFHEPSAYGYIQGTAWRDFELLLAPFITASDYRVYWGAAGAIDSVIDLTYNTVVPFSTKVSSSWGILNQAASTGVGSPDANPALLTAGDFACIAPLPSFALTGKPACTATPYVLASTAIPGAMGYIATSLGIASAPSTFLTTPKPATGAGFGLYIKGRVFQVELAGGALPTAGTQWTMRDWLGGLYGGNGTDPTCAPAAANCQWGTYAFLTMLPLPFTAPGASSGVKFDIQNSVVPITTDILAQVHTVPDPYYVTSAYDLAVNNKDIQFVNVPAGATIRIYTTSGILIRVLQNTSTTGAIIHWNVRNRTNQFVSSGVYVYSVESGGLSHAGRMTIVNYANTVQ